MKPKGSGQTWTCFFNIRFILGFGVLHSKRIRDAISYVGFMAICVLTSVLHPNVALATHNEPVQQGVFLVADPTLTDHNFRKTVIYVWAHGDDGTHGIVINRPMRAKLTNVLPMVEAFKKLTMNVYFGGPVTRTLPVLLFQHAGQPPIGQPVSGDVYISTDLDILTKSPELPWLDEGFRVYAGYAGWAPGQLASELAEGAWRVRRGDAQYIFSKHPETVWEKLFHASDAIHVSTPALGAAVATTLPFQ